MSEVNFFIVGAPKCGTTALYHYLENHPQVFLSEPKEVNFFSKKELAEQKLYYQDFKPKNEREYLELFSKATINHKIIGEASVSYLFYPEVAKRIYDYNSNSKIVILLRNPVERAWSHFLMDRRLGLVKKEFIEVFKSKNEEDKLNFQQYFLLGNYFEQVNRYLKLFGSKNVKIIFSDELKNNTDIIVNELFKFLEIDHFSVNDKIKHNSYKEVKGAAFRKLYTISFFRKNVKRVIPERWLQKIYGKIFNLNVPQILESDKNTLKEYYNEDICKLENMLGKDLSLWK